MKKKQPEYKIEKTVSSSKTVNTHLVTKNNLKQYYIMKQIHLVNLDKEEIDNHLAEVKLMSSLDYKFILKLNDSFQLNKIYYTILEYCDGGTLSEYIDQTKKSKKHIKEDLIWKIFIQIALGVAYLHRKNIIHRNITPSNILLTQDFNAKISGMKESKKLSGKQFANSVRGTPYYLAPEILEHRPYRKKVDIWSLGILCYKLCSLNIPFEGKTLTDVLMNIKENKVPAIPKIYSKELQGFVNFLLNKDELSRPTIDEVILTYVFISKSKNVNLYDYVIKSYPNIEEKKVMIKSVKDRKNEKKVYLKKKEVELYVNNTKNNYSDFFNHLKNMPIDTEVFNYKDFIGMEAQSITKFLEEETKDNSSNSNNQSNSTLIINHTGDQNMTKTFVPLVANDESNLNFEVIDNENLAQNIEASNNDKHKENYDDDDMIKITKDKVQRFEWIYEIEEKIDYLHGEISSIFSDEKREQMFNELINNHKVNDDLFEQEEYSNPLLKQSYNNLVYYQNQLDKVKKDIFNNK